MDRAPCRNAGAAGVGNLPSDADLRGLGLTDLPLLRCLLIAGVGCKYATPAIKTAAFSAAADASFLGFATFASYAFSTAAAADAAAAATAADANAAASAASRAASAVFRAAFSAARAAAATWNEVKQDCIGLQQNISTVTTPLWSSAPNPFQDEWDQTSAKWQADPDYAFWLRWYEDALIGTPPN